MTFVVTGAKIRKFCEKKALATKENYEERSCISIKIGNFAPACASRARFINYIN